MERISVQALAALVTNKFTFFTVPQIAQKKRKFRKRCCPHAPTQYADMISPDMFFRACVYEFEMMKTALNRFFLLRCYRMRSTRSGFSCPSGRRQTGNGKRERNMNDKNVNFTFKTNKTENR